MLKIELSTMYTPYTLDTYGTFTFDHTEEGLIDWYNEEHNTDYDYDSFEWTYDNKGYIKELADNLITLLNNNILDDVIKKVEYNGKVFSPKEYNFKTDDCDLIFTVDPKKLNQFIQEHKEDYNHNKIQDRDGFWWFGNEEETRLNYYLREVSAKKYNSADYQIDQFEQVEDYNFVQSTLISKEEE